MAIPHVIEARHLGRHRVWLRFDDDELVGPVFEPLRDPGYFAHFVVDETLTWPNGADFAPEFLRERVRAASSTERPAG